VLNAGVVGIVVGESPAGPTGTVASLPVAVTTAGWALLGTVLVAALVAAAWPANRRATADAATQPSDPPAAGATRTTSDQPRGARR
jgi:hypothetical protein